MARLQTFIVEDSPVIRENLIATLEELADVDVVGAADTESSAVEWLARLDEPCDLVIVDIFLKSGSGLGVLAAQATKADGRRVVVLSNYATTDMRRKCLELGADRVFDKSNEIDSLVQYCMQLSSGNGVATRPSPLS